MSLNCKTLSKTISKSYVFQNVVVEQNFKRKMTFLKIAEKSFSPAIKKSQTTSKDLKVDNDMET